MHFNSFVKTYLFDIVIKEKKGELEIICEFVAYKEKLLKEKIYLTGPEKEEALVTIFARVLGMFSVSWFA